MLILERNEEEVKKKITLEGWVSKYTDVEDIIINTTEGKLDFSDMDAIYKTMGSKEDWDDEWPPKRISIILEILE
jgi:hypothetical protein